ncbi:hypothetical protein E9529_19640 [Blastococcus sp. KM273128]|uniref:hypothetical protein n=1 Tax=Blastococcus sp. KM273128 TaxID=2570314 RepID=UPI001F2BDAE4|nr:hypothetical protein [Blastococcus sp. KM273128]MCF6746445.1 hypothetical protein [Blastococcus sp. KM273128]
MQRPQSPAAWAAVAALPVAIVGLVVMVVGMVADSDWWLLGSCLASLAILASTVALFRMQTRGK